jgi:hypothetical protein
MDNRVDLTTDELATTLNIWLTIVGQRRPSLLRDLWTRKGEDHNAQRIHGARRELARFLAERMAVSGWAVTRQRTLHDTLWEGAERTEPDAGR